MDDLVGEKALLLFFTIPLPLIVNIVWVSGTGILAAYFGAKVARGFPHEFSRLWSLGWVSC